MENFDHMAQLAEASNAVVIRGTGSHFNDEVLSWHHINGVEGKQILPAILITTRHPRQFFLHQFDVKASNRGVAQDRMIFIPLNGVCTTPTDVVNLVEGIFADIRGQKQLLHFDVVREMKRGESGALVDALMLRPNYHGLGFDIPLLYKWLAGKVRSLVGLKRTN